MEEISKITGLVVALWGVGLAIVSFFLWKYLIPKQTTKMFREELQYRVQQDEQKDKELQKFRGQRDADLQRLSRDEEQIDRLKQRVEELAAWRYGAERYMVALEKTLAKQGLQVPNRADFGIDGED